MEQGFITHLLWDWGEKIEELAEDFPLLKNVCKGLKKNQFTAALFVAGGLMMTLMTRCTYRFYHRPEELRRLNNSTLIIGDPASGKSFATRLFKLLAAPIVAADKLGKDAINAYREQMRTKGANKEKPKKPKVIVRVHPARTSNAQFIQDMVNSVENVDGVDMQLHMLTFDTELDNTVTVQKVGSSKNLGGEVPLVISSGFRSEEVNRKCGGAKGSNHLTGCAVDVKCLGPEQMIRYACLLLDTADENGWVFDELIQEKRGTTYWIHFAVRPKDNRRKILFDCR